LFHVREEDDEGNITKQTKTEQSIRFIPIHPELIKMGFMDYVDSLRKQKKRRLCYDLRQNKEGYYSAQFSKWFADFLDNIGAKKNKTSFHSFRHNFRTAMANAGLSYDAITSLGGWSSGTVESGYLGDMEAQNLYNQIQKIQYPGLDLSHLYTEKATDGQNSLQNQATG